MKRILAFVLLGLAILGCRAVMEKDIEDGIVQLNSPSDGLRSGVFYQKFYWEKMDGASAYRIQISAGNFTDSMNLVTDSTTKATQYSTSLSKGTYQWRVAGVNNGYTSQFCPYRTLIIDSTGEIGSQVIQLLAPSTNPTNETTIAFSWKYLPQANSYTFKLDSSNVNLVTQSGILQPSFSRKFSKDGIYNWSVQGVDAKGRTTEFSSRGLITDYTGPVVGLSSPAHKASSANPITFTWNITEANGLSVHQLFVYRDSSAAPTPYSSAFPRNKNLGQGIQSDTFSMKDSKLDKIWWKITATDKAGNTTESEMRRVNFQR